MFSHSLQQNVNTFQLWGCIRPSIRSHIWFRSFYLWYLACFLHFFATLVLKKVGGRKDMSALRAESWGGGRPPCPPGSYAVAPV